jgi:hypothetical protein
MSRTHPLIALVLTLGAVTLGAGPAEAVTVSPQTELRSPKTFPVAMPGRFKQGARIPRTWVLLRRTVEMRASEGRAEVEFRCPGRRRVWTIATNDPGEIGIELPERMRNYRARTVLRLRAYASPNVPGDDLARGRIYVLCRPR